MPAKPVNRRRGENESASYYTTVSDKSRQRHPDEPHDGESPRGSRAGPVRSDDSYAQRRLIAERYILHSHTGRAREAVTQRTADSVPSSISSAAEPTDDDLIADRGPLGPRIDSGSFEPIHSTEETSDPELRITGNERLESRTSQRRPTATELDHSSRLGRFIIWIAAVASCAGLACIGYGAHLSNPRTAEIAGAAEPAGAVPAASTEPAPAAATADLAPAAATGTAAPTAEAEITPGSISAAPAIDGPAIDGPAIDDPPPVDRRLNGSAPADTAGDTGFAADSGPPAVAAAPAPSGFEFAQTRRTVFEDSAIATLVIRRTGSTGGEKSLSWWTTGDTAVADEDFASFGTLTETFADGEQSRAIHIPLVVDEIVEPAERFFVTLRYDSTLNAPANSRAELVILDDD